MFGVSHVYSKNLSQYMVVKQTKHGDWKVLGKVRTTGTFFIQMRSKPTDKLVSYKVISVGA